MAAPPGTGSVATLRRADNRPRALTSIVQGATVSGLNPKGLMLFVALLPQFVTPASAWPMPAQMFVLGCVFIVSAVAVYLLLGIFACTVLAGSARAARVLTGVAGAAMIAVAAAMAGEHFLA